MLNTNLLSEVALSASLLVSNFLGMVPGSRRCGPGARS